MRIALAQINTHLGNFESNSQKIIDYISGAKDRRCDVVLFPEATLFGYHPMDLLKRQSVVNEQARFIKKIENKIPAGIVAVFGAFTKNPSSRGKPYFNTALVVERGRKTRACHKELLPTYDVFDDARHIEPGDVSQNLFRIKGKKVLITICEDIWAWPMNVKKTESSYSHNPIKKIKPGSVDLILNLSASPFYSGKMAKRLFVTRETAKHCRAPLVYVNMVGGQDELIFDGGSFAISKSGKILAQCSQFSEDLNVFDLQLERGGFRELADEREENLRQALVLGLRDFVTKSGQHRVHLGLSGGIDSAVVACLAVDALGAQKVKAYALPGPYSSDLSLKLAKKLAQNLGIELKELAIHESYENVIHQLDQLKGPQPFGLMHENVQARLRGLMLMAISNSEGSLLLNTSNKTEFAAGYGTLYGDMAGAISPIGDLLKGDVYALAQHYNFQSEIIPREILTRAPSAELREDQKDQDTLPPYDLLDQSVVNLVEKARPPKTSTDHFLLKALMSSEFKRWQAPPILKVREHSFGQGRRMPIAHRGWY